MQIEIKEIVSSYAIDIDGQTVQARITRNTDESGDFLWDISHHRTGASGVVKPSAVPASSRREALVQIIAYAESFEYGYAPRPNIAY